MTDRPAMAGGAELSSGASCEKSMTGAGMRGEAGTLVWAAIGAGEAAREEGAEGWRGIGGFIAGLVPAAADGVDWRNSWGVCEFIGGCG